MASLADLLNPTFLMFLGILVLVVALLVVYFESKMRDQNHKIASMLSLVSTLAEDMNGMKMGLNHLAMRGGVGFQNPNINIKENLGMQEVIQENNKLIEVSDDEESESEEEEENEEAEDSESSDLDEINDLDESESENGDIKVIKLQVVKDDNEDVDSYGGEANNLEFEDLDGEFEPSEELPEMTDEYVEQVLDLKYENKEKQELNLEENNIHSSSDFKTISINLGDDHHIFEENIDYKKLQLPKLRSIAVEKGIVSNTEASKLKKPELLKLLGVE